jgi:CRISPR/Cas system-associated exonuclease Cas4 (RecB family)
MNIEHMSVSRDGVIQLCEKQYDYKYHQKLPRPDDIEEPFYFVYGKMIHKIAEMYVENKGQLTLEQVTKQVTSGQVVLEEGFEDKPAVYAPKKILADYKKRMPKHLRAIQKLTDQIGFDGICEHAFYYDLDPPHGRHVKGFIDRLIEKNGEYWIIDYKTSKKNRWRKNRTNITKDLQLRTYARVVQREFKVPAEKIRAALYYLEDGLLLGAKFTEESLLEAEAHLLKSYKHIENLPQENAYGNVGDHCKRCDYVKLCPFYRMT